MGASIQMIILFTNLIVGCLFTLVSYFLTGNFLRAKNKSLICLLTTAYLMSSVWFIFIAPYLSDNFVESEFYIVFGSILSLLLIFIPFISAIGVSIFLKNHLRIMKKKELIIWGSFCSLSWLLILIAFAYVANLPM